MLREPRDCRTSPLTPYRDRAEVVADVGHIRREPDAGAKGGVGLRPSRGCTRHPSACFSVSRKLAWLISPSGAILRTVPVLGGRPGHETPRGRFRVIRKDKDHDSSLYTTPGSRRRAPMPDYVQFAPAIGFHQGSLGVLSHGCVHCAPTTHEPSSPP